MPRYVQGDEDCGDCLCRFCARNEYSDCYNPEVETADCVPCSNCIPGESVLVDVADDCPRSSFAPDADVFDCTGSMPRIEWIRRLAPIEFASLLESIRNGTFFEGPISYDGRDYFDHLQDWLKWLGAVEDAKRMAASRFSWAETIEPSPSARPIDAERLKWVIKKNFGEQGGASVILQLIDVAPTMELGHGEITKLQ